jgi:hypothetical protein
LTKHRHTLKYDVLTNCAQVLNFKQLALVGICSRRNLSCQYHGLPLVTQASKKFLANSYRRGRGKEGEVTEGMEEGRDEG